MRVTLHVTAGPHQGRAFTFAGHDTFLVGRSGRAHFRLPLKDKTISRVHFMVEVNPPHCRVLDMASRNGTFVNRQKVTVADLKDGDMINAGKTVLRVSIPGEETTPVSVISGSDPSEAQGGAVYSTLKPARKGADAPARPGPAEPMQTPPYAPTTEPERCRICAALMPVGGPARPPGCPAPLPIPICQDCQQQIRNQPQPIAGFQIVRELGRGAMGIVSLALREADGMLVALKTLTPAVDATPTDVVRFIREARLLRVLDHPHIVAFREIGEARGRVFFAMDYVSGIDGARLLKEHGPLSINRAVGLVCQLLGALTYAHDQGIVHRDIKPANVLVTQAGECEVAKLTDFGLARVYQASQLSGLTLVGDRGGTPAFISPEQITHYRDAKPTADQYATGATLYNLLTARFVFDPPSTSERFLLMVLQDKPVPIRSRRPDLPKGLADVIHRSLAKEPGDRFPNVKAMRKALVPFCQ